MNQFLIALQFITTIPIKLDLDYSDEAMAGSMLYYPLVGSLLALILLLANYFLLSSLPPLVNSALLVAGLIVLTGGIHLDGLMDSGDGLFCGGNRERMLDVMRDSRVGAFGAIALLTVLLLKYSLLAEMSAAYLSAGLILALTISRWSMVYAVYNYSYARKEGLGKVYKQNLTKVHLIVATLWTVGLALLLFGIKGLIIFLLSWIILLVTVKISLDKLGGLTGDIYGALNELFEVVVLVLIFIILNL